MRLFIPPLGTELTLTTDWTFKLYSEDRNQGMYQMLQQEMKPAWDDKKMVYDPLKKRWVNPDGHPNIDVILARGTRLAVDRIYIRQGGEDFDSVTFRLLSLPVEEQVGLVLAGGHKSKTLFGKKYLARFWVKLADANNIEYEEVKNG